MRTRHSRFVALTLMVVFGIFASSCTKQVAVHDPLGTVTLLPPYPTSYPGALTDRISIQYAVIAIANQAGIGYDWDTSFKNTDPECRRFVAPVIINRPFAQALETILAPANLTYTIVNGKIILGHRI